MYKPRIPLNRLLGRMAEIEEFVDNYISDCHSKYSFGAEDMPRSIGFCMYHNLYKFCEKKKEEYRDE